jgi:3-isopropylmalate/(R)-2-methylmalate dehydratase small subunit
MSDTQVYSAVEMRPTVVEGRVWVLRDPAGKLLDDIDTDMIFHNAHLAVTDVAKMGRFALGNLAGWERFPEQVRPGDIVVAGRNFGAGSSRQQAVDCFVSLGISLLIAESFGAIYKRNAINAGFAIMEGGGLALATGPAGGPLLASGDAIRVDLATGEVAHLGAATTHRARSLSQVALDIYLAGDLFAYGRTVQ